MRTIRTLKAREAFLAALSTGLSITASAKAAGFRRTAAFEWRKDDPDFAAAWEEAVEEATDGFEDIARERAVEKSDTLLSMMLKARRPEKYRDRVQVGGDPTAPLVVQTVKSFVKDQAPQ